MMFPHVWMVNFGEGSSSEEAIPMYNGFLLNKQQFDHLISMGMPPMRNGRGGFHIHASLPPPRHSPTMLVNTNAGQHLWRSGYFEDAIDENRENGERPFTPPFLEKHMRDDSSEDSYLSSTSSTQKGCKFGRANDVRGNIHRYPTPLYPYQSDENYGKRNPTGQVYQRGRQRKFNARGYPTGNSSYIPPDRFLSHGGLVYVSDSPPQHVKGFQRDILSKNIWKMFISKQQTVETYRSKIRLWRELFIFIRKSFPKYGLFLVGSTMSGLGSNSSDVDMCLLVRPTGSIDQRSEALHHLEHVALYLGQCEIIHNIELIQAKVPILKLKSNELEVDLNCNNSVGIRNTHLLYCYARADWRVRPLVVVVKLWAAHNDINDAKRMTVSSYSWALMVIHFLQCVKPAVLPCLQDLYGEKFSPSADINHIDLHEDIALKASTNTDSLGKLLLGFLRYYTYFEYDLFAVSVRAASKIPIDDCRRFRSLKNDPHQWKYLCIEEPFDRSNTARSVYDYGAFERVRQAIKQGYERLSSTGQLESLFDETWPQ